MNGVAASSEGFKRPFRERGALGKAFAGSVHKRVWSGVLIAVALFPSARAGSAVLDALYPTLDQACGVSKDPLVQQFFNISAVCDLRDMVYDLKPLLEQGSWENLFKSVGKTVAGHLAKLSGVQGGADAVNALFAQAKTNVKSAVNTFENAGDALAVQLQAKIASGAGLSASSQTTLTTLPAPLKAGVGRILGQLGDQAGQNVQDGAANATRLALSGQASQLADTVAGEQAGRVAAAVSPVGGTVSQLGAELAGSLSTRDSIETVGRINLEMLKNQLLSSSSIANQLAALSSQMAVSNEVMVNQYNQTLLANQGKLESVQGDIDRLLSVVGSQMTTSSIDTQQTLDLIDALGGSGP